MTDPATGQRSFLQALRVPFDLKGVALGAVAFLVLVLVGRQIGGGYSPWAWTLDLATGPDAKAVRFDGAAAWKSALLHLVVAAIFGVACCRIAAMRLARDEGVDLSAAVGFSLANLPSTLGAVLFLVAAAGFFLACNAVAGLLCGIPGVGAFLAIPLFPLVLISTVILFLILFGAWFGFPLCVASLAVERNGALDAVSRAFSYVFSRPALFFFYALTVGFLASVLAGCAFGMKALLAWSFTLWFPEGTGGHADLARALQAAVAGVQGMSMPDFDGKFGGIGRVEGTPVLAGWIAWIGMMGLHLAMMGWVVYYAFGGATAAYFALRRDVDGTEEEELWVEGEDAERFGEPVNPTPAAPPPPAADETRKA